MKKAKKKQRILVTGSKGVVGSWLVPMLRDNGHTVLGIDLTHAPGEVGWEHRMANTDLSYARCDVSDFRQISRIVEQAGPFDLIYHAAAEFGRWNGEDYYEQLWRTNAIGTKNIIRLQEKHGFRLVHFSSSEVYGDYERVMKEGVMDKIEIKQLNDYAMSKWVNEMQVRNSSSQHGTETVVIRLFNTFGPGEWYHPYRSVNAKFCYHALHNLPITVYRGHYRTSTYLEDTCRTIANIAERFRAGRVYNIGGTQHHSIEDLVDVVIRATGARKSLVRYRESEILTTKTKRVDTRLAMKELGHKMTVSLEEGVQRTVDWMREYYGIN